MRESLQKWENVFKNFIITNDKLGKFEKFIKLIDKSYNYVDENFLEVALALIDFKTDNFNKEIPLRLSYHDEKVYRLLFTSYSANLARIISDYKYSKDPQSYKNLLKIISLLPNSNFFSISKELKHNDVLNINDSSNDIKTIDDIINVLNAENVIYSIPFVNVYKHMNYKELNEIHQILIDNGNLPKEYLKLDNESVEQLLSSFIKRKKFKEFVWVSQMSEFDFITNYNPLLMVDSFNELKELMDSLNIDPLQFNKNFMRDIAEKKYGNKFVEYRNSFISDDDIKNENAINLRNLILKAKKDSVKTFLKEQEGKINFSKTFRDKDFIEKFFKSNMYWVWEELNKNNIKNIDSVYFDYSLLEVALRRPGIDKWTFKNAFYKNITNILTEEGFSKIINNYPNYMKNLSMKNIENYAKSHMVLIIEPDSKQKKYFMYEKKKEYNYIFDAVKLHSGYVMYTESLDLLDILIKNKLLTVEQKTLINNEVLNLSSIVDKNVKLELNHILNKSIYMEFLLLNEVSKNTNNNFNFYEIVENIQVSNKTIYLENGREKVINAKGNFALEVINAALEINKNNDEFKNFAINKSFEVIVKVLDNDHRNTEIFNLLNLLYSTINYYKFDLKNLTEKNKRYLPKIDKWIDENAKEGFNLPQSYVDEVLTYFSNKMLVSIMNDDIIKAQSKSKLIRKF